jgi:hypothetical protein
MFPKNRSPSRVRAAAAERAGAPDDRREVDFRTPINLTLALALAALLGACARVGDFDRPNPSYFHDSILPVVGAYAAQHRGEPVSSAPWTDDERTLRDLAYAIIAPPITRQKWLLTLTDLRQSRVLPNDHPPFEVEKYASTLIDVPYRSATARYSRLVDDIRADSVRITPFFTVAKRVVDMDTARERSLTGVAALTPQEREIALARIAENRMVIGWVYRRLGERAHGYRFALERLFLKTPAPAAVDAERALRAYEERLARIPVLTGPALVAVDGPQIFKD